MTTIDDMGKKMKKDSDCKGVILLKKIIKKNNKKIIKRRFLEYECVIYDNFDTVGGSKAFSIEYIIILPRMKKRITFIKHGKGNDVGVTKLIGWMKRKINFHGYEIEATSSGWNHRGKPIDRTWLLG